MLSPSPVGRQTAASWPALSWLEKCEWLQLLFTCLKISERTESCWLRLPPSSKTLGPFQMELTGESGQVTKGTKLEVIGTDL